MTQWTLLVDEARADDLAAARMRERWLRRQATEAATLVGTLLDLAESGTAVSVALAGGRRHDGRIVALGHDVVVLADRDTVVAINLGAVTVVRPHPGQDARPATGDRAAALDLRFVELLARLAGDEPEVAIALVGGDALAGSLLAAGADVITLRLAPGRDGIAYCASPSVASARFRSG